jgi:hypothetical protein
MIIGGKWRCLSETSIQNHGTALLGPICLWRSHVSTKSGQIQVEFFFCPINLTIVSECRKKNCKQSHTDFCSFFGRVGVTQLTGKTRLRLWSWRLTSSRYYVVESVVIAVYDQSLVHLLENPRYRYPGSDDGSDVGVALAHERIHLGTAVRWWRYEV